MVCEKANADKAMTQGDHWVEILRCWTIYHDGRKGTEEYLLFEGKKIVVTTEFEIQHWREGYISC